MFDAAVVLYGLVVVVIGRFHVGWKKVITGNRARRYGLILLFPSVPACAVGAAAPFIDRTQIPWFKIAILQSVLSVIAVIVAWKLGRAYYARQIAATGHRSSR